MRRSFAVVLLVVVVNGMSWGQGAVPGRAATLEQAKSVLDLSGKPLIDCIGDPQTRIASQSYQCDGETVKIAKQLDEIMQQRGFTRLDGASFTDAYCSSVYQKSGFTVSLMVMPSGMPDVASVTLLNQGDVNLRGLPKPESKELYVQPASAIFTCELSVDQAKVRCRELLEGAGWEWFGDTTVSFFMRQNAVRLQVMCSESPAQPGVTTLHYSTELMSSTLPMVPDLVRVAYSDMTTTLDGDSTLGVDEFATAYRKTLTEAGWNATTEQPIKIDFRDHLIFVNQAKEMAELSFYTVESVTRFQLRFQTAEQVERESQQAKMAVLQAQTKRDADEARLLNPTRIVIARPDGADIRQATKQKLEFTVRSGTAKAAVSQWIQSCKDAGWKIETLVESREVGEYKLTKGEQVISASFVDPGFIPGEITLKTSPTFQLDLAK
ncbi:hypothetical protein [Stieleria varia]|uniref:Uncharacterized protein n=1 Tax=Stieleria varia TaxID=2528005 RepID=A0A5C5ZY82_9BACT|nr:hypothetical protein [Stieleria varia]TWT91978.1 hypothetical protein Pla52n_64510 [Stieleria varia]